MLPKNMHNKSHYIDPHYCHMCTQPFKVA